MITGINIVRNCIENGYPFVEAILSAYPMCSEYLINDGGSTDGTIDVLERLQKKYPRIIIYEIPDKPNVRWDSVSDQINTLIQDAGGDTIFLGNADELIHEQDLPRVQEWCHRMREKVQRFDRREITHDWSRLSQEVYHPARVAKNVDGLFQDWNAYGGDEFLQMTEEEKHWFDPERENRMNITLYHLYNMFPGNRLSKLRNDAEYLAPGDKQRVMIYERAKENKVSYNPPTDVLPSLPALARGLPYMREYHVRECLFNVDWVEQVTRLCYSSPPRQEP